MKVFLVLFYFTGTGQILPMQDATECEKWGGADDLSVAALVAERNVRIPNLESMGLYVLPGLTWTRHGLYSWAGCMSNEPQV